jgi:hypothetical protein
MIQCQSKLFKKNCNLAFFLNLNDRIWSIYHVLHLISGHLEKYRSFENIEYVGYSSLSSIAAITSA